MFFLIRKAPYGIFVNQRLPPTISSYTVSSLFSIVSSPKTFQRLCSCGSPLACTREGGFTPCPALLTDHARCQVPGRHPGHVLCDFFLLHVLSASE